MELLVRPIGFVRTPFAEKVEAPRQPSAAHGVEARIEVLPEFEHGLADLEGFERIWVLFVFDRSMSEDRSSRNKVLPPRSDRRRGVFATRSPHRPNPIGLSAVRLVRVEGRNVHIRDVDLLDGTPVVDIKPYLAYADAFPDAHAGWLEARDPRPRWEVELEPEVEEQLAWLAERDGLDLRARIVDALSLGPAPHPYRRIRPVEGREGVAVLAVKEWRARFRESGDADPARARTLIVERLSSGYRPREIERGQTPAHALHRAFVERFPERFG